MELPARPRVDAAAPTQQPLPRRARRRLPAASGLPSGRSAGADRRAALHPHPWTDLRRPSRAVRPPPGAPRVPSGIGIAPPQRRRGAYVLGGACSYPIRTFEPTGVVVVDARPAGRSAYALFAVWGQPLSRRALGSFRGPVRAFVGGRRWPGAPGSIPLGPTRRDRARDRRRGAPPSRATASRPACEPAHMSLALTCRPCPSGSRGCSRCSRSLAADARAGRRRAPTAIRPATSCSARTSSIPTRPPVSPAIQKTLNAETAAASRAGFPIKVALIASPIDLGVIPDLFGKPQKYADFLDQEISFRPAAAAGGDGGRLRRAGGQRPATAAVAVATPSPPARPATTSRRRRSPPWPSSRRPPDTRSRAWRAAPGRSSGSGGSSTTPILIALVVAAVLTAAALIVLRRRQARPPAPTADARLSPSDAARRAARAAPTRRRLAQLAAPRASRSTRAAA